MPLNWDISSITIKAPFFLPFIVNEDIRNVIVKTLTSIKLKGHKAPNLNILFILQNLQGTLQNLQGTTGNCALHKAFTIHPFLNFMKFYILLNVFDAMMQVRGVVAAPGVRQ